MDNFRDSYFNVTWDLTKKHLRGTFWGKQYDTGRGFAVTIVEGGQVTVPSTETVRLKWEKPDSTEGYVTAVVVDDKFLIENIDQMFTVHGAVRSDLEIWRGGKVISSITFYVSVEKAVAVDAIESSSQFTALQEALADVGDMQAQVDAVIANATVDSEVILARGAEPTLGDRLDADKAALEAGKVDKLMATNLITNGDFSQGATGWSINNGTISVSNGMLNYVAGTRYGNVRQFITTVTLHKYYVYALIKSTSSLVKLDIRNSTGASEISLSHSGNNSAERLSFIHSETSGQVRYFSVSDSRSTGFDTIYVDDFGAIDLTATFGAGNEPTKEQMDRLLEEFPNSWFDGTADLMNMKTVRARLDSTDAQLADITSTLTVENQTWEVV